ncbi:hypothetical protein ASF60_10720 [Methylobacterium sp. Leaf113]|nr:hypothetical protein ASF60_10720 [Methylobacterium sp. Leaf113]
MAAYSPMPLHRLTTFGGEFASASREAAFQAERLPETLRHTWVIFLTCIAVNVLLFANDASFLSGQDGLGEMLVARLTILLATLGGLVALPHIRTFARLQQLLILWQVLVSVAIGCLCGSRTDNAVLATLLVPSAFMLLLPLSFAWTAIAGSFSGIVLLAGYLMPRSAPAAGIGMTIEVSLAILTILLFVARSNRLRRLEWAAAGAERKVSGELAESRELFEAMFRAVPVPIVMSNAATGRLVSTNDAGFRFFEIGAGDVLTNYGTRHFLSQADHHQVQEILGRQAVIRDRETSIEVLTGERRDVLLSVETLQVDGIVCHVSSLVDITSRKAAEAQIRLAANHDVLTGLANRALFQATLDTALARAASEDAQVGLILLDLDAFKEINDTLGHDSGDALLKEVARRLCQVIGPDDLVARLGGDEFVILSCGTDGSGRSRIHDVAARILDALRPTMPIGGRVVSLRASLGLALYPEHARNPADLFTNADLALYAAKASGRNRATLFAPALRASIEDRVTVTREMRAALEMGSGLVAHYQPKIDMLSGAVIGFEALARWQHPTRGLLKPRDFSAVFDDGEIGIAASDALRRQIIADILHWIGLGLEPGRVFLNLASVQFAHGDLTRAFLDDVDGAGLPRARVGVEVTETVLLGSHVDRVSSVLSELHAAGIRVALDDFGTGYASLTHLKQFPVDEIKIDRSFIQDLGRNTNDAAIVAAVLQLGRSLGLDITAEGVETAEQAGFLRDHGCTFVQGYLHAKPMAANRVPGFLRNRLDRLGDEEAGIVRQIA